MASLKQKLEYMFKKFPIRMIMFRNFRNALDIDIYKARLQTRVTKDPESGKDIDRNYIIYKEGKNYIEIPTFTLPNWFLLKEQQTLMLMEVDVDTYHALTFEDNVLVEHIPQFETEITLDEEGNQNQRFKLDDKGRAIQSRDADGNLVYITKEVLNTTEILENGKKIKRPDLRMLKNYDPRQWYALELLTAHRMFSQTDTLRYWAPLIVAALTLIALIAIAYVSIGEYAKISNGYLTANQALTSALGDVSNKIVLACKGTLPDIVRPPG
jgi:hypothetical protein